MTNTGKSSKSKSSKSSTQASSPSAGPKMKSQSTQTSLTGEVVSNEKFQRVGKLVRYCQSILAELYGKIASNKDGLRECQTVVERVDEQLVALIERSDEGRSEIEDFLSSNAQGNRSLEVSNLSFLNDSHQQHPAPLASSTMIHQSGGGGYRRQVHESQVEVSRSQHGSQHGSSSSSHRRRSQSADSVANSSFRGHHHYNLKAEDSPSDESMLNVSNGSVDFATQMNTSLNAQWSKHFPEDFRNVADRRNRR